MVRRCPAQTAPASSRSVLDFCSNVSEMTAAVIQAFFVSAVRLLATVSSKKNTRLPNWLLFCLGSLPWLLSGCTENLERDVIVHATVDEQSAYPILNAFERTTDHETGVIAKFGVETTGSNGFVDRIVGTGDVPYADLFWDNEVMLTMRLQKLGLLQPRRWEVSPNWPTDMIAGDGTWCGFAARARVLLINTDLIPDASSRPDSVSELADPKWEQQCAIASPLSGTTETHFAVLGERIGAAEMLTFARKVSQNAVVLPGSKRVARAVSAGRIAWGLTDSDHAMVESESGSPVAIVFPDQKPSQPGTLRIPNTVAILKGAPHPVAAGRLADYLISAQTEDRLAMGPSSQLPINQGTQFPPAVLPNVPVRWMRVDFQAAAEGWNDTASKLAEIFAETGQALSPEAAD